MFEGIASFFATIGFGYLFQVPKNRLVVIALIGMLGGIVYKLAIYFGTTESSALFMASILVSLLSEVAARKLKTPVTIFLACALIPLVPGSGLYYTMLDIVSNDFEMAFFTFISTIINACSIVIGCTLISSFIHTIIALNRRFKAKA